MRACNNQVVIDGDICCDVDKGPCTDGVPSKTDKHLLLGCGDINEPDDGTRWQGAL